MIDDYESGAVCEIKIGKGNTSIQRKSAAVSLVHHKSNIT
jgi:hypothetical protein